LAIRHAQRLAALLDAHLLIDDGNHGANWNHRRALDGLLSNLPGSGAGRRRAACGFKVTDWLALP
jgi:hypothetical protein